jgi:hypothetical protein
MTQPIDLDAVIRNLKEDNRMSHCLPYDPFVYVSAQNGKEYFLYKSRRSADGHFNYVISERCRRGALKGMPSGMAIVEDEATGVPSLHNIGLG